MTRTGVRLALVAAAAVLGLVVVVPLAAVRGESAPPPAPTPDLDELARVPWEGGSAYWEQFPRADAAGWSDPGFFPVVAWFNGISTDEEARYDAAHGINTYIGMADTTPYQLFADNDLFWIGGALNDTFTPASTNWVGYFLDDEVDGRFPPEEGMRHLEEAVASTPPGGFFRYANFTQIVVGQDMPAATSEQFVNGYTDAVSVDMYWYTIPFCDWEPYRGRGYLVPIEEANCRTASSYGRTLEALRQRDAADGRLQPLWQFVENLNGGPGEGPFLGHITPGQLQGAVMNSVINEARGIVYFNQSLSGPCTGGNVFRQSQVVADYCGAAQVEAAGEVNNRIHELAPVINTQSYAYEFGSGLDTMLKTHDGHAYVFAMIDGESQPGGRTFQLPGGISGRSVEVLFEDRTLPVDAEGRFTDTFEAEYSYHVYRVEL